MSEFDYGPLQKLIDDYVRLVDGEFNDVIGLWKKDLSKPEVFETIGGLLARQATLACEFALSPSTWTEHCTPLFLRPMVDCLISIAWILKDPKASSRKFILYGLGQEKLLMEHFKAKIEAGGKNPNDDDRIKKWEELLAAQRFPWLTDVNVGSWSDVDTRSMAEQANVPDWYKFYFQPYSSGIHNTWQHIFRFNLVHCTNPLHRYHRVPVRRFLNSDPHYLIQSANIVDETFSLFRKKMGMANSPKSVSESLNDLLTSFGKNNREDEKTK